MGLSNLSVWASERLTKAGYELVRPKGNLKDLKDCTPKGRRALLRIPTTGRAKCLPMLGAFKT